MSRILLVDDVRLFRHLESVILGWRGFTIEEASTGEEALEKIRANPPDLALVDLTMPGMSGLELCAVIKKDPALQSIPVIIVASSGNDEDIRKAVQAGCDDYLTKPLDDITLVTKVEDVLGRTARRRYPRISTSLQISFEDFKGIFFEYTRDISRTGVFIEMQTPLPVGTRLRLSFSLPPPFDHPVMAYAKVVRCVEPSDDHPGGVGASFIFLDENSERVIDELVGGQAEFEEAQGVFSQVSFQTDNAPIGEAPPDPERTNVLSEEEKRSLQSSYQELQEEHLRLSARLTLVESLHEADSADKLREVALDVLGDLLGVASGGVFLYDTKSHELVEFASRKIPDEMKGRPQPVEPMQAVFSQGTLQVPVPPWQSEEGSWELVAAAPIRFGDKILGLIAIFELYRQKATLNTHDHQLLELMGNHLAQVMINLATRTRSTCEWTAAAIIEGLS
jgi:CheY-like chemotaxis protein